MVGLAEEGPLAWYQSRGLWVQFPPATEFFAARILSSLASGGTAAPEREQATPTATACTQEGGCWTIAEEAHSPLPYHLSFMVGLVEEGPPPLALPIIFIHDL
jgi:hypothetical protein